MQKGSDDQSMQCLYINGTQVNSCTVYVHIPLANYYSNNCYKNCVLLKQPYTVRISHANSLTLFYCSVYLQHCTL